jgi:hypothetical protein
MKLLSSALISAGALAATAAAAQTTILPGYWETTSQVTSPFPARKTEQRCIRAEDVDKVIAGSPNHNYTCDYPTKQIGGGKIRLAGSCRTKTGDPVPISSEGVYTHDSLQLNATVRVKFGGITVPVHARTTARRLADTCPAPTAAK